MGRIKLSPQRRSELKRTNIGRIIIFCEGKTEKHYFDYFAEIIKENKYNEIEVVLETAGGNAQTVLNFANSYMADDINNQKYINYGKYLVFDCDDPPNIQETILASREYELLVSNQLFETWLLMHFEEINSKLTKRQIFHRLSEHLHGHYSKGHKGKTREIIQNGNIEKAIDNARLLEQRYADNHQSIYKDIKTMDPYTSVHQLIEQFMLEISA